MLITSYPTRLHLLVLQILTSPQSILQQLLSAFQERVVVDVEPPTGTELNAFYEMLLIFCEACYFEDYPTILKAVYSTSFPYISSYSHISQLYYPDALGMNYLELLSRCEEVAANLKVRYFSQA